VDIEIFGSLKTYPTFVGNADFNDNDTAMDVLLDEGGYLDNDEVTVRNEFRLGFKGTGENWSFMVILESDIALEKNNCDRGARAGEISTNGGFTGEDYGVEKLEFTYDFTSNGLPATVETGWNTKWLDIETGGLLYGDDHPYIGLRGKYNDVAWEVLNLFIFDDVATNGNGDDQDWAAYTIKAAFPVGSMKLVPFYAYSDNEEADANVHYFGAETFGKIGMFIPKAEFVYAIGDKEKNNDVDYDISAYAAFAALETDYLPLFNPYIGGYYVTGDDDANDDDIEAFNTITNISRYTGTFGMENAFIYRYATALGTHLYSNTPSRWGTAGTGYGGISNSDTAESPGMMSLGIGSKGGSGNWKYKAQVQYFWLEETGAIEDVKGRSIDDELGMEFDLQITYVFNKHFSLGNCLSIFEPGDAIEDYNGAGYDDTAILDTIEFIWSF
jgi:hypothetical protein